MKRTVILFFMSMTMLFAAPQDEMSYIKQKDEIISLKKELTEFYNKKEQEYQNRKKELDALIAQLEKEKKEIAKLHEQNKIVLKDIQGEVVSKTSKIYNKMKPKDAATILNQMMDEGKVEDVFDIILKLKEKNVTSLLKYLNVQHAALLTEKLKNYNTN